MNHVDTLKQLREVREVLAEAERNLQRAAEQDDDEARHFLDGDAHELERQSALLARGLRDQADVLYEAAE
jgi:hypothetical protein